MDFSLLQEESGKDNRPHWPDTWVKWARVGVTFGLLLLIFLFYLWTVKSCSIRLVSDQPFDYKKYQLYGMLWPGDPYGFYNLLADSLLAGKLSLLVEPPKELLELGNPYDPEQHRPYHMWDASLYKGKYYLYFGPTPVLTLFIPFRLLDFGHISEPFAAVVFAFGGLLWSVLLLSHLVKKHFPSTPFWMCLAGYVCLGLCNFIPFILRRAVVYEVAVLSGYFYMMGGLYFAFKGLSAKTKWWRFSLASLSLGLAVGARPTTILAGFILLLIWLITLRNQYHWKWRPAMRELACLAVPYLACGLLLGLYNYLRFDAWFEVGHNYLLNDVQNRTIPKFSLGNILPGIYFYWFQPFRFDSFFPYFHLVPWYNYHLPQWYPWSLPKGWLYVEQVTGLLPAVPIVAMSFFSALVFIRVHKDRNPLILILGSLVVLGLATFLFVSFVLPAVTMRYQCDYLPVLLISALLVWFYLDRVIPKPFFRAIFRALILLLIMYSSAFNVAVSFTGYFDMLKYRRPWTYYSLEERFWPLTKLLATFTKEDKPRIVDLYVPGGIDRGEKGEASFFWLGTIPAILKVYSPFPSEVQIKAQWLPDPALPSSSYRTIVVQSNYREVRRFQFNRQTCIGILRIPVEAGPNWITLQAMGKPNIAGFEDREKLLGVYKPRLNFGSEDPASWQELFPGRFRVGWE